MPADNDPGIWGAVAARSMGTAVMGRIHHGSGICRLGFAATVGGVGTDYVTLDNTSLKLPNGTVIGTISAATDYDICIPLWDTGYPILTKLPASSTYTVNYVDNTTATANVAPYWASRTDVCTVKPFKKLNLGTYDSRAASRYGFATSRLVSPAANATATMQADAVNEVTFTYATGAQSGLTYRQVDANNKWSCYADTDGSLKLVSTVTGTPATVANVAATFVNATAYRVVIVCQGNQHTVYVNNVSKASYTDASNLFLTATATVTIGTLAEEICWPRLIALPSELG